MDSPPRVLAILVAHDAGPLLGDVLDGLEGQSYPQLEIIAVDNASTDGSRERLLDRLGPDRVLVAERDLGFTGAVSLALDSAAARGSAPSWLLLSHDDLILEADAVERLVTYAAADPRVAVVGPKLRSLEEPRYLQQVGMRVDITGRADSGVEPDEVDQGQRDTPRPVLYVSTAGMLVRHDVFERLGRFDPRYGLYREDLDVCWRAWIAGHVVAVVPDAVGRHLRGHYEDHRLGEFASVGRHYLAERNTLATLLKCYGLGRLLLVIPLFFLVGIAKTGGFLFTRRFADATETLRAWGWNLREVRTTVRLRRRVQARRVRTDSELRPLFIRLGVRFRAYSEAIAERLVGDDLGVALGAPGPTDGGGVVAFARRRPGLVAALCLAVVALVATLPLLGSGPLRGGDLAPWPASSLDLVRAYVWRWTDAGGAGTGAQTSPAQALLGAFGMLAFDSAWLAPRLLLVGALPAAWLVALRAGRLLTPRRAPRLAGATLYVASPPALAAVMTGRLGAIVLTVALPALTLAGARLVRTDVPRAAAWRAAAAAALLIAVVVAFEPPTAPLVALLAAVGLGALVALPARLAARVDAAARLLASVAGAALMLLPWLPSLLRADGALLGGFSAPQGAAAPFARWLLLVPEMAGFPGAWVGAAFLVAGLLALLLAGLHRPLAVGLCWGLVLAGVYGGWWVGRTGTEALLWPGVPLLVAGLGYAALLTVALAAARTVLSAQAFGWRHVSALVATAAIGAGGVGAAAHLIGGTWDAFVVDTPALPSFIGAEDDVAMRYRVLTLADDDDAVRWDLTDGDGPSMLDFGTARSTALEEVVGDAVRDVIAEVTPHAAASLGHANVRYVYVPEGGRSGELEAALDEQLTLEPQPVERGLVYEVRDWLPRVAYLPPQLAVALVRGERLPEEPEPVPLYRAEPARWTGEAPSRGVLAIAEAAVEGWRATHDGEPLDPVVGERLARYIVPGGGTVAVTFDAGELRTVALAVQAGAVLLGISLALRAPSFAREDRR